MESTAKYIVPLVGGPMDGAVLYLQVTPQPTLIVPGYMTGIPSVFDVRILPSPYCGPVHKYLLQPSPARYIYEHLACS